VGQTVHDRLEGVFDEARSKVDAVAIWLDNADGNQISTRSAAGIYACGAFRSHVGGRVSVDVLRPRLRTRRTCYNR
jgi:hypothetical protein